LVVQHTDLSSITFYDEGTGTERPYSTCFSMGPSLGLVVLTDCTIGLHMIQKTTWAALAASLVLLAASGCAVSRGQESMGAYLDDTGITTLVKSRFFEDKDVAGTSIGVETLNGTVMLSGFAKSTLERNKAETIARGVRGVTSVKNEIAVRP
jgi:osmotically-inducible protein OsmY